LVGRSLEKFIRTKIMKNESVAVFRPMRVEDRGTVAKMMRALYRDLQLPDGYITDDKIDATIRQLQVQPGHLVLDVFELDGTIVGYALLFKFWYNEFGGMVLNIDELFVESNSRSKGIAANYLLQLEKREGGDYVALSLEVLPANERAYSLYKRIGFTEKETVVLYKILSADA
jgi:ribosomal protein S18 acetylase RimI-like enzyme